MPNEIATMRRTLAPTTFAEAYRFAEQLAKSSMVPAEYRGKPENILLAIQWGQELGIAPLQAIQNIAVINGKPSVYGDTLIALVRGSPVCDDVIETFEGEGDRFTAICEARRKGKTPVRSSFSVADAKEAGLWGKTGPWKQYPRRMLQMRARGFALRDAFPDVLRGVITMEEAADYPVNVNTRAPVDVTPRADLDRFAAAAETEIVDAETGEITETPGLSEIEQAELGTLVVRGDAAAAAGQPSFVEFWNCGEAKSYRKELMPRLEGWRQIVLAAAIPTNVPDEDPFGLPPLSTDNSPAAQQTGQKVTDGLGGPASGGGVAAPQYHGGESLGADADDRLSRASPALGNASESPSARTQPSLLDPEPENLAVPLPARPTPDQLDYFARQVLALIGEAPPTALRLALIRAANERGLGLLRAGAVAQYDSVMAALAQKPARAA